MGRVLPGLTGRGQLVRQPEAQRKAEELVEEEEESELTMDDIAAAIFLAGGFFVLATLVAKKILPLCLGWPFPTLPT